MMCTLAEGQRNGWLFSSLVAVGGGVLVRPAESKFWASLGPQLCLTATPPQPNFLLKTYRGKMSLTLREPDPLRWPLSHMWNPTKSATQPPAGLGLENKEQNVPPCLMAPEGGGECKFQYESMTLSQPDSTARRVWTFLGTNPSNAVWARSEERIRILSNRQRMFSCSSPLRPCHHPLDTDPPWQTHFCKDRFLGWLPSQWAV